MTAQNRDALFANPLGEVTEFQFSQAVVDVFPDMLKRSIPGYETIIAQTGLLAARYAKNHSKLYDLGCSLGATAIAMDAALQREDDPLQRVTDYQIIGVDNSSAMINRCEQVLEHVYSDEFVSKGHITLELGDIKDILVEHASVVALNFTLQFVPKASRDKLMQRIADGMQPGGALILSEKIAFADHEINEQHIEMYHAFKSANGYSDLEIAQKRTALENVLVPETLEAHYQRLRVSGFSKSSVWFQCFNFASIIAVKE